MLFRTLICEYLLRKLFQILTCSAPPCLVWKMSFDKYHARFLFPDFILRKKLILFLHILTLLLSIILFLVIQWSAHLFYCDSILHLWFYFAHFKMFIVYLNILIFQVSIEDLCPFLFKAVFSFFICRSFLYVLNMSFIGY